MAKIFNVSARAVFTRIFNAPADLLLRMGVSPDAVTVVGTLGVVAGSVMFAFTGRFITGTVIVTLSALHRPHRRQHGPQARPDGGKFGAFLDSTCDRVADGAIFGAVAYWMGVHDRTLGRRRRAGLPGRRPGRLLREGARRGPRA